MKSGLWFGVGVLVTLIVVTALLLGGWLLWHDRAWGMPIQGGRAMMGSQGYESECRDPPYGSGRGSSWGSRQQGERPLSCPLVGDQSASPAGNLTLEEAEEAFRDYLTEAHHSDLLVAEVMEFDRNFYAIAQEPDTQMGAMELLIDKSRGYVSLEIGPNMMWNTKYGMHESRGMMGDSQTGEVLSEDEVLKIAQAWLDANRTGDTVEDADPFYGYYTIHTERDGRITGMLSVHSTTGQVWYHTWHGEFVGMLEHEAESTAN